VLGPAFGLFEECPHKEKNAILVILWQLAEQMDQFLNCGGLFWLWRKISG